VVGVAGWGRGEDLNKGMMNRGDAEEDRLREVALTAMKVANDPHLLPYPL